MASRAKWSIARTKPVAALPEILSFDRRAVRQRFEDRFTSTRMAKDYVGTYRRLLNTCTSGARLRQLALNGGNGLAPISIEKPFVTLFEAGADPEIQSEKPRIVLAKNPDHRSVRCAAAVLRHAGGSEPGSIAQG